MPRGLSASSALYFALHSSIVSAAALAEVPYKHNAATITRLRTIIRGCVMSRAKASGFKLDHDDVPIILGMIERGDRDHDIAAWFGVNQGRIKNAKDGKYGLGDPAPAHTLPPKGAPGIKGRYLRDAVEQALAMIEAGDDDKASTVLLRAKERYDRNQT